MNNIETTDFKELAQKIIPDKHVYIKCNQNIARVGIICDSCITKLHQLISEFGLTDRQRQRGNVVE